MCSEGVAWFWTLISTSSLTCTAGLCCNEQRGRKRYAI